MNTKPGTFNPLAVLDALDALNDEWAAFGRQAGGLIAGFEAVTTESDLQAAVEKLIVASRDYPYLWLLLHQASNKRPPSPTKSLTFNPKEVAGRYQDLLAKLESGRFRKGHR